MIIGLRRTHCPPKSGLTYYASDIHLKNIEIVPHMLNWISLPTPSHHGPRSLYLNHLPATAAFCSRLPNLVNTQIQNLARSPELSHGMSWATP